MKRQLPSQDKVCIYTSRDFPYGASAENFVRMMALGIYENDGNVEVVRLRGRITHHNNDTPVSCRNLLFSYRPKNEWGKLLEWLILPIWIPFYLICRRIYKGKEFLLLYGIEYATWGFPFFLTCSLLRQKCFRIVTEKYPDRGLAPVFWKKPKLLFYQLQYRFVDRMFDGLIVLSVKMKQYYQNIGVSESKILVVHHFVKTSIDPRSILEKNAGPFIVGFSGNTDVKNGTVNLIRAFAMVVRQIPETLLWIMGHPSLELQKLANELGMNESQIVFKGFLEHHNALECIKKCHVMINPRAQDEETEYAFSTKVAEYFSLGKPTILVGNKNTNHLFKNIQAAYITENCQIEDIQNALVYSYNHYDEMIKISQNAKQWAIQNLDYHKNGLRVIHFIRGVSKTNQS